MVFWPNEVNEALVHGERLVRAGDKVRLLPVDLREKDEDAGDLFAQKDFNSSLRRLGSEGPFTIVWMHQWPCGRKELYVKTRKKSPVGVYACEFM